jgi:hypothetical protein
LIGNEYTEHPILEIKPKYTNKKTKGQYIPDESEGQWARRGHWSRVGPMIGDYQSSLHRLAYREGAIINSLLLLLTQKNMKHQQKA